MSTKLKSNTPTPILVQQVLHQMGKRAHIVRKARRMTQEDLAHLAGVGISTIAAIEGGREGVALGNLLKVLKALDLLDQAAGLFSLDDPALKEFALSRLAP